MTCQGHARWSCQTFLRVLAPDGEHVTPRRLSIFFSFPTADHVLIGRFFSSLLLLAPRLVGDNKELTASKVVKRGGKSADAQVRRLSRSG
jgi:hypothetical protein